jgi:putative membrane protein
MRQALRPAAERSAGGLPAGRPTNGSIMGSWYLLLKSVHIMAVISWMAGLLYLFRLYVYHRAESEAVVQARFRVMALVGCAVAGQLWLAVKLALVVALLAVHLLAGRWRRAFLEPPLPLSERAFRILNEVPTLLMIGIVLLAVFKPAWGWWGFCG